MRIREGFREGTLGADLVTTGTTIDFGSDPGFATLASGNYLVLIIDPEGAANGPEVVYLTAFTSGNTTGTISRGQEGTSDPGVSHASGTAWVHGPTVDDFDRNVWAVEAHDLSGAADVEIDLTGCEMVKVVGWVRPATDATNLVCQLSPDGGSTWRTTDFDVVLAFDYSTGGFSGAHDQWGGSSTDPNVAIILSNVAGEESYIDLEIICPNESGVGTGMLALTRTHHSSDGAMVLHSTVTYNTAEAHDRAKILMASGNMTGRLVVYRFPSP